MREKNAVSSECAVNVMQLIIFASNERTLMKMLERKLQTHSSSSMSCYVQSLSLSSSPRCPSEWVPDSAGRRPTSSKSFQIHVIIPSICASTTTESNVLIHLHLRADAGPGWAGFCVNRPLWDQTSESSRWIQQVLFIFYDRCRYLMPFKKKVFQ